MTAAPLPPLSASRQNTTAFLLRSIAIVLKAGGLRERFFGGNLGVRVTLSRAFPLPESGLTLFLGAR